MPQNSPFLSLIQTSGTFAISGICNFLICKVLATFQSLDWIQFNLSEEIASVGEAVNSMWVVALSLFNRTGDFEILAVQSIILQQLHHRCTTEVLMGLGFAVNGSSWWLCRWSCMPGHGADEGRWVSSIAVHRSTGSRERFLYPPFLGGGAH